MSAERWYAVYTKPNGEDIAEVNLDLCFPELDPAHYGFGEDDLNAEVKDYEGDFYMCIEASPPRTAGNTAR